MNEPLKNKKYTHTSIQDKPLWTCYPEHEIKSAVEWLKIKVTHTHGCQDYKIDKGLPCQCDYNQRINLIDQAFPDLKTSPNKDFTAQSVSPKEKINVLLCCDCKAELIDDDIEEDRRKSIRCPECWAKMEEEVNLED